MKKRNLIMAIVLGLALLLFVAISTFLCLGVEDWTGKDTPPPGTAGPAGDYTLQFGPPHEWLVAGVKGETYEESLSGADLRTGTGDVYLGQSPPDGPYLLSYVVGRAYAGWDTSALPDGAEVLSATLVLELPAGGGREEPLDIAIYQGTWNAPLGLDDWCSPGDKVVGHWRLPASLVEERQHVRTGQGLVLYAPEPARTVRVTLDPDVVDATGVTRLALRHAREGTLPTTADLVLLGRTMITLEVKYRP